MKNISIVLIFATVMIIALFTFYPVSNAGESTNIQPYDFQYTSINGVPDVRQPNDYSCGPTSLQAVLSYYGMDVGVDTLIKKSNSSYQEGTAPENISMVAREYGLNSEVKEGLTLEDLRYYIQQKIPVIIECQAWTEQHDVDWTQDKEDGHYMVVVGMNRDNIYFEDPAILGSLGYMSQQEFLDRWHDEDMDPATGQIKKIYHLGIITSGKSPVISQGLMKVD